jgi:hypothetical protein
MTMPRRMLLTTTQSLFTGDECPIELPTFDGNLAGAYLLGTDYWDGSSFTTIKDGSGFDRDLTLTGSMGAKSLSGPDNFATLPFSVDDLCIARGSCTLVAVSQIAADAAGHFFGSYSSFSQRYVSLFASSTYALQGLTKNGSTNNLVSDPDSDNLRSGFEFLAITVSTSSMALWRSKAGAGLRKTGSAATIPAVGGESPIMIGKGFNGAAPAGQHAFAACFSKALSDTEMATFFAKVTLLLAGGGTTVAQ